MLVLNTNTPLQFANRQLTRQQEVMTRLLDRLGSGLKLNSASDNSAGLGFSERITSRIRAVNESIRNANHGINLLQGASEVAGQGTEMLQRMRQLAVQAASGQLTFSDRRAIDKEFQSLIKEIDRSVAGLIINGINPLDGSGGLLPLSMGESSDGSGGIELDLSGSIMATGGRSERVGSAVGQDAINGQVSINGIVVNSSVAGSDAGQTAASAWAKALAINKSEIEGVTAVATNQLEKATHQFGVETFPAGRGIQITDANGYFNMSINGVANVIDLRGTVSLTDQEVVGTINATSNETGVEAFIHPEIGNIAFRAVDGRDIRIETSHTADLAFWESGTEIQRGTISIQYPPDKGVSISDGGDEGGGSTTIGMGDITIEANPDVNSSAYGLALDGAHLLDSGNASGALVRIDQALETIGRVNAIHGAGLNRLGSVLSLLGEMETSLRSTQSRIVDADMASDSAGLIRSQILRQTGMAIAAQAGQMPSVTLRLLNGS